MKRQFIGIFTALVVVTLLPYCITTIINPANKSTNTVTPIDGRIIIMEEENSDNRQYMDYNNYIKYMTARNLMAFEPEIISKCPEFVELNCILSNTFLEKNYSGMTTINEESLADYLTDDATLQTLWKDKYDEYMTIIDNSILNTKGQYLGFKGNAITPFYHFLSSGATRESLDENLSYLKSVETSSDFEAPGFLTVIAYTWEDFVNMVNNSTADGKPLLTLTDSPKDQIQITKRDSAGYVESLIINEHAISGTDFSAIFSLKSTAFTLIYGDESIKLVTKGMGHGYGISLTYALNMLQSGESIQDVINYFFNDVEIICS